MTLKTWIGWEGIGLGSWGTQWPSIASCSFRVRDICVLTCPCVPLAPPVKATLFCGLWWESLETLPSRTFCGQE